MSATRNQQNKVLGAGGERPGINFHALPHDGIAVSLYPFVDSTAAPILENAQLDARADGDQIAFALAPAGGGNNDA